MIDPTVRAMPRDLLRDRYGVRETRRVGPLVAVGLVLAVAILAWLGRAVLHNSSGISDGVVQSFDVTSPHAVSVTVNVHHATDTAVTCTIQALADDHSIVGQLDLHISAAGSTDLTRTIDVRTDREATTAQIVGCT